jgi:MFS family permease
MFQKLRGIYEHNIQVFYFVDVLRSLWFLSSVWVLYERQFLSLPQLTIIEAVVTGVTLIMQLPTGAFADMFGKKIAMITGCILYAIGIYYYSYSTTFSMFLVYAIIFGVAGACIDGTREALLYDTLKQDKRESEFSKISSKLSMIFQIALACAVFIGGWIGTYSFTFVIRLTAFSMFASGIASFFFIEPAVEKKKFTLGNYFNKTKLGIKELFKNSYIKKVSLYYIIIGSLTWVCVFSLNMILLTEMKYSTSEIGVVVGIGRIIVSVLIFRLILMSSFFTKKRTFVMLPILLSITFLPSMLLTKWFILIPVMGAVFVSAARWNILSHYTNAEFDSSNRATAISTLTMVVGFVYVVVMSLSGIVMEKFGGARIIYSVLGIIALCVALPLGIDLSRNHSE